MASSAASGPLEIVLASRNPHKLAELGALLKPWRLVRLPDGVQLPPEDGSSFADNALLKARAAARETGRRALADDSGIVVAALDGAPGVYSARYAGEHASDEQNLGKLLDEMRGVEDRRAAYVCVLALAQPPQSGQPVPEQIVEGRCEGKLTKAPRGSGGFGYDPAFIPEHYAAEDLTMAEMTQQQKDAISHRGEAARLLAQRLAGSA